MATSYPTALDTTSVLEDTMVDSTPTAADHAAQHVNISDAVIALETELGTIPKGTFANVKSRLNNAVYLTPGASQTIQASATGVVGLIVKQFSTSTAHLFEARLNDSTIVWYVDATGVANSQGYKVAGAGLASTHLADSAALARLASPALSGTPTSTTPGGSDSSTRIATTAFVATTFAKLASPAFTGTPTAPTATAGQGDDQVATTAFVATAILNAATIPAGTIMEYAGSSLPDGWLWCDGAYYSSLAYAHLFSIIGGTYGLNTLQTPHLFAVPDARGRVVVGFAASGGHPDVASLGNTEGVALQYRRGSHRHTVVVTVPPNAQFAKSFLGASAGSGSIPTLAAGTPSVQVGSTTTDALDTPAYIVLNRIIKT